MKEDSLGMFKQSFADVLNDMADRIDPKESKDVTKRRIGLGRIMDFAILTRKGFQQAWQFISIIQAMFIILGLSEQVSHALGLLGIRISPFQIGILAVGGIIFFVLFGMAMLLYGGSQRSSFLVNQKQNPAQIMDYMFYKEMAKKMEEIEEKIEGKEEDKSEKHG